MILRSAVIFCLSICQCLSTETVPIETAPEDVLRRDLLRNYNSKAIPAMKTVVSIAFTIQHYTMNEKINSLDLDFWTSLEWKDPRLRWSADFYSNVSKLAFDPSEIWHPDLTIYNSAKGGSVDFKIPTQIVASNDGRMIWVPPGHIKSACFLNMRYWPHDVHNCTAKFGSWVHSANTLDFELKNDDFNYEETLMISKEGNLTRGEWDVVESYVVRDTNLYSCCPEEYVSLRATMVLRRVAPAYGWIVQMPVVVLCLMTIAVFLLPPAAGEKVILGAITLFLDFFFLSEVSSIIGHTANHSPLIVELIGKQLTLTGASVLISVLILRLVRDPHSSGLPTFIKIPIVALSTCLCLNGYRQMVATTMVPITTRSMKGEDLELNESGGSRALFPPDSKRGSENDWILLAAVIDRICLIAFTVIFLIHMITYSSVL